MTSRRAQRRNRGPERVVIAGDNVVAAALGQYEAISHKNELPIKKPGQHRWIATAAFVLTEPEVAVAYDKDSPKFLDHENLFHLSIGCWDCEQPLGEIKVGSRCPAPGLDR